MANGIPSRRLQISTTAPASSALASEKRAATLRARSTNKLTAAESMSAPTSNDGTSHSCSSGTPSPSRLVARIFTVAEATNLLPQLRRLLREVTREWECIRKLNPEIQKARDNAPLDGFSKFGVEYIESVVLKKEPRHFINDPGFVAPSRTMSFIGG